MYSAERRDLDSAVIEWLATLDLDTLYLLKCRRRSTPLRGSTSRARTYTYSARLSTMAAQHHHRKAAAGVVGSTATLSTAASEMLRSLGLDAVDPEHVFELQSKEGAGAFGRVFRACYKHDRARLAALKVIPVALEAGQRGEDIESVRKEIQFLRECDHPNVVAFYGAYYKDGALWVAMEYCGGGSVGDVRRARALREDEIAVIMRGALRGLAYLHSKKKIHRDIKGGNILLTTTGQVKIADFGVSAQLRDTMSRRGTFVGTPYWMSPEMIQDSDYDYKSDIWSLGITAIELADQKPPLFDEHPMRVLIQIPRNPPPQLKRPSAWTPLFAQFLHFCLQKDPVERPSALECLDHAFIAAVAHVDRVFANAPPTVAGADVAAATAIASSEQQQAGESDERAADSAGARVQPLVPSEGAVAESAALEAPDALATRSSASECALVQAAEQEQPPSATETEATMSSDDIAEDIARLDDDDDGGESSGSSSDAEDDDSDSSGGDDDGAAAHINHSSRSSASSSSVSGSDSFNFRQPTVTAAAGDTLASLSMVSGDELLELSVSGSTDVLPDMKTRTVHGTGSQSAHASPLPAVSTSTSEPSTELRLLPSASASPLPKHRRSAGFSASATTSFSIGSHLDASSDRVEAAAATPSRRETLSKATITATPKSLASVSLTWQNPLADVSPAAVGASSARLNGLLNLSLSASLTSSSTRLFTKLLHDEEQARVRSQSPSNSISSSRYATPRSELVRDRSDSTTPHRALQLSSTLTPSAAAAAPRHRYTRSSVAASTHFLSSSVTAPVDASARTLQTVRPRQVTVAGGGGRESSQAPMSSLEPSTPPPGSAQRESAVREATRASALTDTSAANDALDASNQPQSLDEQMRRAIDRLWTELAAHGVDSVETLRASPLVLIAHFAHYQRSVLALVAASAQQRDAKRWADTALAQLSSETGVLSEQLLPIPPSLQSVARWLRAALSADALLELLVCERTARDKLAQLRMRYPVLLSKTTSGYDSTRSDSRTLAPAQVHELLRHQLCTSTPGTRTVRSCQSNQDDDDDNDARDNETKTLGMTSQWLQDGARDLVEWSADANDSASERLRRIEMIVLASKQEPALATIVSGLSTRSELRSVVQTALQTHVPRVLK